MEKLKLEVRKLERRETKQGTETTNLFCEIGPSLTGVLEDLNEIMGGCITIGT